jgi:hypothetical protein
MSTLSLPNGEPLHLTRHASARLQQRGIPAWFLGLLVEHGAEFGGMDAGSSPA